MGIHSTEKWESGQAKTHSWFQSLEMTVAADSLPRLNVLQGQGWHLYVCMSPLVAGSTHRKKDRVAAIRSVYCEADENGEAVREEMRKAVAAGEIPVPHYAIESSPGKFQFIWLVEGFTTTAQQEQMNSSLQVRFKTDPASVDCVRVLRLPGFLNLKPKYGPDFPVSRIVGKKNAPRYHPEDFKIKIVDPVRAADYREPIADEEINKIVNFLADALNEAGVEFGDITNLPSGAVKIHLTECPWGDEHSDNKRGDADLFVNSDGSLGFWCFHSHCAARDWAVFRQELEDRAGHKLQFGESGVIVGEGVSAEEYKKMLEQLGAQPGQIVEQPPVENKTEEVTARPKDETVAENNPVEQPTEPPVEIKVTDNAATDASLDERVPPYDKNLIRGIYETAVELVAGGTSMPVQFPHIIAKTFFGLRAAVQGIDFQDCDAEPRLYTLNIGETGTSKGWSMERSRKLFTNFGKELPGNRGAQDIKIWDGADSGAGLKECFFDPPANAGVLLYLDETIELGQKARADRNPEIVSVLLALSDSTNLARGLKDKDKRKQKTDARLAMVMCVQPDIIPAAFAGIKTGTLGLFNRITPEFSDPVIPRGTPKMEDQKDKVEEFYAKYIGLDFSKMHINQGGFAKARIEDYWNSLPLREQTEVRRKKNIYLDQFMIRLALMVGCKKINPIGETSLQDADDAIANDQRQAIIRRLYLNTQTTDVIGVYLDKLKKITGKQMEKIRHGVAPEVAALTQRDYVKLTNAHRENEEHIFERAWRPFVGMYLMSITKPQAGGPKTVWYVPRP